VRPSSHRTALEWSYGNFECPAGLRPLAAKAIMPRPRRSKPKWTATLATYRSQYPAEAAEFERNAARLSCPRLGSDAARPSPSLDKGLATRQYSYNCLNANRPQACPDA